MRRPSFVPRQHFGAGAVRDSFLYERSKVMLPGRAVVADLPRASDRLTVIADGAGVALAEVERREVCVVAPQSTDVVRERHLVDAGDSARVEVVLQVSVLVRGVHAD